MVPWITFYHNMTAILYTMTQTTAHPEWYGRATHETASTVDAHQANALVRYSLLCIKYCILVPVVWRTVTKLSLIHTNAEIQQVPNNSNQSDSLCRRYTLSKRHAKNLPHCTSHVPVYVIGSSPGYTWVQRPQSIFRRNMTWYNHTFIYMYIRMWHFR